MNPQDNNRQIPFSEDAGYSSYARKRIAVSVAAFIAAIWILSLALEQINISDQQQIPLFETTLTRPMELTLAEAPANNIAESSNQVETSNLRLPIEPIDPIDNQTARRNATPLAEADNTDSEKSANQPSRLNMGPPSQSSDLSPLGSTTQLWHLTKKDLAIGALNNVEKNTVPQTPGDKKTLKEASPLEQGEEDTTANHPANEAVAGDADSNHKGQDSLPVGDEGQGQQVTKPHVDQKHAGKARHDKGPVGIAFVEAVIKPIENELKHHFWGWRPNDFLNLTDNVNNLQLGVLEVTRRTMVQLTQRISRTGSTDAFNPHLKNAMNWLMVKADRYWFPSPESKYKESLKELAGYKEMLLSGEASFYTRTDNIIPLLTAYEDLLGSCDENLVKSKEDDGSKVSFFQADDYFYYAKGVAKAMAVILEAIHHDFAYILESRNGNELLHHAILSCKLADQLKPLIVMNSDLDGLFANHRANMAAPISHARFYLGQLIKTLST